MNGLRVSSAVLREHDIVRVGATMFKVVLEGAEGYRDHRLDGTRRGETDAKAEARRAAGVAGGYRISKLLAALDRVAKAQVTVVLRGESGTGKEVFARHLHTASGRKGRFVAVNTAALAQGLVESELFGVKRGSYTGAGQDRQGYVREAAGGTLFLDEIGDMRLEAQSCLLRVLQEREVVPVGSTLPEKVDVRVVCATHRDLEQRVADGSFRGDLFARLQECLIEVPPLRERREDIVPLCRMLQARHGRPDLGLSPSFVEPLFCDTLQYNVRELESILKRAIALARPDARFLAKEDLPDAMRGSRPPGLSTGEVAVPRTLQSPMSTEGDRLTPAVVVESAATSGVATAPGAAPSSLAPVPEIPHDLLRGMLAFHKGNVKATAIAFGIARNTFYRVLQAHGLDATQFRE